MERITVIGLGLIGGSLGLALKKAKGAAVEITGFSRRAETLARARAVGAIDKTADDPASAVSQAHTVFIATPVMKIGETLRQISGHLPHGCIVTDAGSTKARVMQWAAECLPDGVHFIGGHPMAGKETSGIDEAEADLLRGCIYCLVPSPGAPRQAVEKMTGLVEAMGARPFFIDAETHDRLVAGVSHLPMMLSTALVSATVNDPAWKDMSKLAARSYRDMTRLASGSPEMSRDICATNRRHIAEWIDRYIEELKKYRRLMENDCEDLGSAFVFSREAREAWLKEVNK